MDVGVGRPPARRPCAMGAIPVPATDIGASASVKHAPTWDVTCPLPIIPSGKGHHFVPAPLTPASRRRRITVEVLENATAGDAPLSDVEICYVRILERMNKRLDTDPLAQKNKGDTKKAKKGHVNFFTGSHRKQGDGDDGSDDGGSLMEAYREPLLQNGKHTGKNTESWQPKYKIPLRLFHVVEKRKRTIIVAIEDKGDSIRREFVFQDESDVSDFCAVIEKNRELSKARLDVALQGIQLKKEEQLTLLFDICSGSDLPRSDKTKDSDPYISVRFNGKRIHKTDCISSTLNPIWTLRKGALFIWKIDALELFESEEGLVFEVKDRDIISSNDSLGAFNISPRTLYGWNGERRVSKLNSFLRNYAMQRTFLTGNVSTGFCTETSVGGKGL